MCGINGVTETNYGKVSLMNERIRHRGPDGSRVWEGEGITLGHNRLAIIDLSDRALQPMHSHDGLFSIVYNGELYNYRELRAELSAQGVRFTTESDTEVLLAAFVAWGEEMFPRLRGIFAFGIWDSRNKKLTLARDHMGVKPLYVKEENGIVAFSSEIGAFEGDGQTLDSVSLEHYLELQYVPSPRTLIQGVQKLQPGHVLVYHEGVSTIRRYYAPAQGIGVPQLPIDGLLPSRTLYETIDSAVLRQLVSDRPVGVFLSGGLDSSIVLHHMSLHARDIKTFSVGFEMVEGAENDHERFNADAVLAERTAKQYGAAHTTHTLSLAHIRNNLETILASQDEPVANPTAVSQYFLAQQVRKDGVVVALGGDGGDELFLGYTRHRMLRAALYMQMLPSFLQQGIVHVYPRARKLTVPAGAAFHTSIMANDETQIAPLLQKPFHGFESVSSLFHERYAAMSRHAPLDAFMYVDRSMWLPDESLHRSDRTSMAHGLELRVPLLDLEVVTLSDTLSSRKKVTPFVGKKILRDTYRGYLPEYLFSQPKRGWVSPGAKWIRDPEVLETMRSILSPGYYDGLDGLYNWKNVETLLQDHVEKRTYALYPLWNILALQVWARRAKIRYQ